MKEKKNKHAKAKKPSGSVKIDPDILNEAKNYCKANGILITFFGTEAFKDRLEKVKSSK